MDDEERWLERGAEDHLVVTRTELAAEMGISVPELTDFLAKWRIEPDEVRRNGTRLYAPSTVRTILSRFSREPDRWCLVHADCRQSRELGRACTARENTPSTSESTSQTTVIGK